MSEGHVVDSNEQLFAAMSTTKYLNKWGKINVPGLELAPIMTGTTATDCTSGQFLFRKLKQQWFLAQMNDLLTILNDLKGPNSDETIRIAATVDAMVSANTRSWKKVVIAGLFSCQNTHGINFLTYLYFYFRSNIRTIFTTLRA